MFLSLPECVALRRYLEILRHCVHLFIQGFLVVSIGILDIEIVFLYPSRISVRLFRCHSTCL